MRTAASATWRFGSGRSAAASTAHARGRSGRARRLRPCAARRARQKLSALGERSNAERRNDRRRRRPRRAARRRRTRSHVTCWRCVMKRRSRRSSPRVSRHIAYGTVNDDRRDAARAAGCSRRARRRRSTSAAPASVAKNPGSASATFDASSDAWNIGSASAQHLVRDRFEPEAVAAAD